ncbi:MAG TPA: helix-turn-helix transcriptional regulator [Acidobacteriota bacterium]|nr:helix-turn-helix transcriptional regulator [Acidobacteriota bacterium]
MPETQDFDEMLPLTPATLHILLSLAEGPCHGYAVKQDVEERTGGRIKLGPGTLYEGIHRLERQQWIEECGAPGEDEHSQRRYYRLSPLGRRVMEAELRRLDEILSFARSRNLAPDSEVA